MKHIGPDLSEALAVGEDSLTPMEISRLAAAIFACEEIFREHFGDPDFSHLSPKDKAARERIYNELMEEAMDSMKSGIIEHRSSQT